MTAQQQPARRGAAIVSRAALAKHQPTIERGAAFAILIVSFVGSILFGGGVEKWLILQPNWPIAAAAFVSQGIMSYFQWVYAHNRPPIYWILIAASSALTIGGFWPLAHPGITEWLQWLAGDSAIAPYSTWLAGCAIIGFALAIDIIPEQILTR